MKTEKNTGTIAFRFRQVLLYICFDNKAAIATLAKLPPNQLWESTLALENLSRSKKVTLVCVCGHHAVPANEADKLAKEENNGVHFDQFVDIPSVVGTVVIRNYLK